MKITIIAVGKIKENYLKQALEEYSRRLSKYCRLEIIEVADEKTPDNAPPAIEEAILKKEGDRIDKVLKSSYVIAAAIEGKSLSSEEFSDSIQRIMHTSSHITFIIGGSLGIHESIKRKADCLISFSAMTFPHQLMRVILLEQIYRAFKIASNEPYHK